MLNLLLLNHGYARPWRGPWCVATRTMLTTVLRKATGFSNEVARRCTYRALMTREAEPSGWCHVSKKIHMGVSENWGTLFGVLFLIRILLFRVLY